MKKLAAAVLTGLMALSAAAPAAAVTPNRTIALDDSGEKSGEWTSDTFAAVAPDFFLGGTAGPDYECGATFEGNCDYTLISITGLTQAEIDAGLAEGKEARSIKDSVPFTVGITNYSVPASDLDIIVWSSNADGDKLAELGRVGDLDTDPSEEYSGSISTTGEAPTQYILLEVVYFAGAGTYDGYVSVS